MSNLEILKLASDLMLAGALIYLCYRILRHPGSSVSSSEVRTLESSLKGLIEEATSSGRTLNDQLVRRQQALERLLTDIGSTETRINRAVNQAQDQRDALAREAGRASQAASLPVEYAAQAAPTNRQVRRAAPLEEEIVLERSFDSAPAEDISAEAELVPRPSVPTNIYGEPIKPPEKSRSPKLTRAAAPAYRPLTAQVERQVDAEAGGTNAARAMEDVYAAAERMLRAGADLNSVSSQTRLSMEDVQMLERIVKQESAMERGRDEARRAQERSPEEKIITQAMAPEVDPRLGVLGGMKRQVQVV